jgi:hypothetical protein
MVINKKSIEKFGPVPEDVISLANKAEQHGKLFSQWHDVIYLFYRETNNESLDGWMIIDNQSRGIHNSIFYSTKDKKFFMQSVNDSLIYEYKDTKNSILHANQFFMHGITKSLVKSTSINKGEC